MSWTIIYPDDHEEAMVCYEKYIQIGAKLISGYDSYNHEYQYGYFMPLSYIIVEIDPIDKIVYVER